MGEAPWREGRSPCADPSQSREVCHPSSSSSTLSASKFQGVNTFWRSTVKLDARESRGDLHEECPPSLRVTVGPAVVARSSPLSASEFHGVNTFSRSSWELDAREGRGYLLEERPTELEDHGQQPPVHAVASSSTACTTGAAGAGACDGLNADDRDAASCYPSGS